MNLLLPFTFGALTFCILPLNAQTTNIRPAKQVKCVYNAQLLIDDMTKPHEVRPAGVPKGCDWEFHPRVNMGPNVPKEWSCAMMWGQVFPAAEGNLATNVRVEIRELALFYLSKRDGKWHALEQDVSATGAAYALDFANDENVPADVKYLKDGTVSVHMLPHRNYHFWATDKGPTRVVVDKEDLAALVSGFKARLVVADLTKPDDRAKARFLGSCGGDYWRALDSAWKADWSNNGDWAIGRFRLLTNEWQAFTACTADAQTIRQNTPPMYPITKAPKR